MLSFELPYNIWLRISMLFHFWQWPVVSLKEQKIIYIYARTLLFIYKHIMKRQPQEKQNNQITTTTTINEKNVR